MDTRPCGGCERGSPFTGLHNPETQCKICWLYHTNPRYKALFTGQPIPEKSILVPPPKPPIDPECVKNQQATKRARPKSIQYPSKAEMAKNIAVATTEWVAAGRPQRTPEECAAIHNICEGCEFYDKVQDRCSKCGCGLSLDASTSWIRLIGIPDAIKMATHHCPINKW